MRAFNFRLIHRHLSSGKEETEREKQISRELMKVAAESPEEIYKKLNTTPSGISVEEVEQRIKAVKYINLPCTRNQWI